MIRVLIAEDQAMVRGALKALLAMEGDIEIVAASVVRIAADSGFLFTAGEYEKSVKEELARQYAAGELTEQELDAVGPGATAEDVWAAIVGRGATVVVVGH